MIPENVGRAVLLHCCGGSCVTVYAVESMTFIIFNRRHVQRGLLYLVVSVFLREFSHYRQRGGQ